MFVSYFQQCHSTSMPFSFQGPQLGLRLTWTWASSHPLPEADINAIFLNVTQLVDLCLACNIFS